MQVTSYYLRFRVKGVGFRVEGLGDYSIQR